MPAFFCSEVCWSIRLPQDARPYSELFNPKMDDFYKSVKSDRSDLFGKAIVVFGFILLMTGITTGEHTEFSRFVSDLPLCFRLGLPILIIAVGVWMITARYRMAPSNDPDCYLSEYEQTIMSRRVDFLYGQPTKTKYRRLTT